MAKIFVAIPVKPTLNQVLRKKCEELAHRMIGHNSSHELVLYFDYTKVKSEAADYTPWSKVTRARNRILNTVDFGFYDYILWIDADVVQYDADLPSQLIAVNPEGITSPLVLVEGTTRAYDWAACVMKDKSHVEPENKAHIKGRNLSPDWPYWDEPKKNPIMEMDCVGTITMVWAKIYTQSFEGQGCQYEDHPSFTDHFSICSAARSMNKKVCIDQRIVAYHADLPKYGENWH